MHLDFFPQKFFMEICKTLHRQTQLNVFCQTATVVDNTYFCTFLFLIFVAMKMYCYFVFNAISRDQFKCCNSLFWVLQGTWLLFVLIVCFVFDFVSMYQVLQYCCRQSSQLSKILRMLLSEAYLEPCQVPYGDLL